MYPSQTALADVTRAIESGLGAAASVLGQTYSVYRLSASSNGSIISGTPLIANFPMIVQREDKAEIENVTFDLEIMIGTCDNTALQIGDVLVETGFDFEPGHKFIFAQFRAPNDSIFVRVENPSGIQRPTPDGGAASQQPISGWIASAGYGGITPGTREVLTLSNGVYAFLPPNTQLPVATVPIGIQQRSRTRERRDPDMPTKIAESEFYGYCPLLNGPEISEMDVIKAAHNDNYEVRSVFTSDAAGLQGFILLLRKLAS